MHVKNELETIRLKNGGILKEEDVVKEARREGHPLHDRFDWDDSKAGHLWRLEQARELIRSVYVVIETTGQKTVSVRAYASLPSDRDREGGYRPIDSIMSNANFRAELLSSAISELEAFKRRYSNLTQLAPVFDAIDAVKIKRSFEKDRKPKRNKAA